MDVEPTPSPATDVPLQLPTRPPDAPLSNRLIPLRPIETSTDSAPTISPSQLTATTGDTLPISTPSAPAAGVGCSVLPQSSPAQTTAVNPSPPPTTTGTASVTTPNVPTHAPLDTLTATGARRSDKPPACSPSATPIVCQNATQFQPSHDQVCMLPFGWVTLADFLILGRADRHFFINCSSIDSNAAGFYPHGEGGKSRFRK